eukprot:497397-Hanusia_phi.AAC.1
MSLESDKTQGPGRHDTDRLKYFCLYTHSLSWLAHGPADRARAALSEAPARDGSLSSTGLVPAY